MPSSTSAMWRTATANVLLEFAASPLCTQSERAAIQTKAREITGDVDAVGLSGLSNLSIRDLLVSAFAKLSPRNGQQPSPFSRLQHSLTEFDVPTLSCAGSKVARRSGQQSLAAPMGTIDSPEWSIARAFLGFAYPVIVPNYAVYVDRALFVMSVDKATGTLCERWFWFGGRTGNGCWTPAKTAGLHRLVPQNLREQMIHRLEKNALECTRQALRFLKSGKPVLAEPTATKPSHCGIPQASKMASRRHFLTVHPHKKGG